MIHMQVISCGIGEALSAGSMAQLECAHKVVGGAGLLDRYSIPPEKRYTITAKAVDEIQELVDSVEEDAQSIVVLGSGDALFHGIGGTLTRAIDSGKVSLSFIPAPTAFQHLCAKCGIIWDELQHFSTHRGALPSPREVLSASIAVVYGGSLKPANVIALDLLQFHPAAAKRPVIIAWELNGEGEYIKECTLEEASGEEAPPTSMLLLLHPESPQEQPLLSLGLPNNAYEHEASLITGEEVRAVILAKLRLPVEGVLWDIGAGSGSVGIEAAGLRPKLEVHAVEKFSSRVKSIERNCITMGVENHRVHHGSALEVIDSLPEPNRIFVGGGGAEITSILDKAFECLSVDGMLVVSAVTLETIQRVYSWQGEAARVSLTIDIAKERSLGRSGYHLYDSNNRITLFIFTKGELDLTISGTKGVSTSEESRKTSGK